MRSIAAPGRCLGGVFRSALLCIVLLPPSPAKAADVFIATAGTASGSGALLGDGAATVRPGLLALHTRVWLRYQDNRVYVMQSEGRDRLLVLIPSAWLAPVVEFSTGSGSAPRDVVVLPTTSCTSRFTAAATWFASTPTTARFLPVSIWATWTTTGFPT